MTAKQQTPFGCTARVAHASRVLVAVFHRNELFLNRQSSEIVDRKESSRLWNTVASTRDVCATQSTLR